MGKRARERTRARRKEAKRLRRETITTQTEGLEPLDEVRLLNDFRLLSERHATGEVSDQSYEVERRRILLELGIEAPGDGS